MDDTSHDASAASPSRSAIALMHHEVAVTCLRVGSDLDSFVEALGEREGSERKKELLTDVIAYKGAYLSYILRDEPAAKRPKRIMLRERLTRYQGAAPDNAATLLEASIDAVVLPMLAACGVTPPRTRPASVSRLRITVSGDMVTEGLDTAEQRLRARLDRFASEFSPEREEQLLHALVAFQLGKLPPAQAEADVLAIAGKSLGGEMLAELRNIMTRSSTGHAIFAGNNSRR